MIHHFSFTMLLTLNWPVPGYLQIRVQPLHWRTPFHSAWGFIGHRYMRVNEDAATSTWHVGPLTVWIGDNRKGQR